MDKGQMARCLDGDPLASSGVADGVKLFPGFGQFRIAHAGQRRHSVCHVTRRDLPAS